MDPAEAVPFDIRDIITVGDDVCLRYLFERGQPACMVGMVVRYYDITDLVGENPSL